MLTDDAKAPAQLRLKTHKQKQKGWGLGWAGSRPSCNKVLIHLIDQSAEHSPSGPF